MNTTFTQDFSNKQRLCSQRRRLLIDKATPEEIAFGKRMDEVGIRYIFQKGFIVGDQFCFADFYLPKPKKIVIEIDGPYHKTLKQQLRDKYKDEYYKLRKMKVIRILNEQVNSFDIKQIL